LDGHTSFVYSVDVLSTGEFVSSGEDRTVRIWKGKRKKKKEYYPT
jgi:phospholipase A-2-activating protein